MKTNQITEYVEPKILGHSLTDIVNLAREIGCDFIPMAQDFLPSALAMMSRGEIVGVQPNPQYRAGDGIIIEIGLD
jgi:hypothetical protein